MAVPPFLLLAIGVVGLSFSGLVVYGGIWPLYKRNKLARSEAYANYIADREERRE